MSQDSMLKKEFNKRDVQRLRNVISGNAGERTIDGIGYTKKTEFHQEGDVWEENGRQWTIKDGIKQNVTKLDKAKSTVMPLFCPSCNKIMNKVIDKDIYPYFKHCFDCHVDFEHELKNKGLWEDYHKHLHNSLVDLTIDEARMWLEEKLTQSNQGWVSEKGEVQNWGGGINTELAQKSLEETIKYLESLKKQ